MRVLIINEECGTGSTGRICTDIAAALEENGNTVKIAFGRNESIMPEKYAKYAIRIGNDADLCIHGIISRIFDATGFGSVRATRELIHWIKKYNPDIIHLHNLHGYYINIELLFNYLKTINIPVIWTLHDVWSFTGHSAYCDAVDCQKWEKGCDHCPQKLVYPKSYIDRSKRNWERKKEIFCGLSKLMIITPSEWLADLVKKSFLGEYPVRVINNGIDTTVFHTMDLQKERYNEFAGEKVILSVATNWSILKGLEDFIKLAQLLDNDYVIVLVGGMTRKQKARLPKNITHIEKTQDVKEMVKLYNIADWYVNLTYCDTYPTVNLEAVACGTPVITYAVGGSAESAKKFGGVLVERGDVNSIASVIENVNKLEINAAIKKDIDKSTFISKYMNLYKDII